jgi:hypothetical protein
MKKVENETLHVEYELIETLTQGMLERFEAHMAKETTEKAEAGEGSGLKTTYGKFLRAAIAIGWVKSGPTMNDDQIANADPRIIALIGKFLLDEYHKASIVPN